MIARTLAAFRREGPGLIATRAASLARNAIGYQKMFVYRMRSGAPALAQQHEIVELDSGGAADDAIPWERPEIESRLSAGARFFALRNGARLVSFVWVSRGTVFHVDEMRRDLKLDTPLTWFWDAKTPPEHRGHGYYSELICHLAARLGPSELILFVRAANAASLRGITKAGFQPWLDVTVTRWSARLTTRGAFDGRVTIGDRG
jgi:hypothetical protein